MKELFNQQEFEQKKSRELLPLECMVCNQTFYRKKHLIQSARNHNVAGKLSTCSRKCMAQKMNTRIQTICDQCSSPISKVVTQFHANKHHFCNNVCSAKYQSAHKQTGTRVSKLEKWMQEKLTKSYPDVQFQFNQTSAIKSELDIYIPSLKLAFELNGIFHYEPIFGNEKLNKIQNNDARKFRACFEQGISLCVIDTSQQKNVTKASCEKYWSIVDSIIQEKLNGAISNT